MRPRPKNPILKQRETDEFRVEREGHGDDDSMQHKARTLIQLGVGEFRPPETAVCQSTCRARGVTHMGLFLCHGLKLSQDVNRHFETPDCHRKKYDVYGSGPVSQGKVPLLPFFFFF